MRSAPSVIYPVGRSRLAGGLLLGLWLLGAGAAAAWCSQAALAPWQGALLAAALATAAGGAMRAARLGAGMRLRWDGREWRIEGRAAPGTGEAVVHLDFQSLLLVRLRRAGAPSAWMWAERAADPARWPALRRALYAPGPIAASARSAPGRP